MSVAAIVATAIIPAIDREGGLNRGANVNNREIVLLWLLLAVKRP